MNKKKILIIILIILGIFIIILNILSSYQMAYLDFFKGIRPAPDMNIPRFHHSSILLDNGNVLIIGGENYEARNTAEIFDVKMNKFIKIENLNFGHRTPYLIKRDDGKILVMDTTPIEIFDPKTNTFKDTNICLFYKNCEKRKYSVSPEFFYKLDKNGNMYITHNENIIFNINNLKVLSRFKNEKKKNGVNPYVAIQSSNLKDYGINNVLNKTAYCCWGIDKLNDERLLITGGRRESINSSRLLPTKHSLFLLKK